MGMVMLLNTYNLLFGLSYETYSRYLFFGCLIDFFCLLHVVKVFGGVGV